MRVNLSYCKVKASFLDHLSRQAASRFPNGTTSSTMIGRPRRVFKNPRQGATALVHTNECMSALVLITTALPFRAETSQWALTDSWLAADDIAPVPHTSCCLWPRTMPECVGDRRRRRLISLGPTRLAVGQGRPETTGHFGRRRWDAVLGRSSSQLELAGQTLEAGRKLSWLVLSTMAARC